MTKKKPKSLQYIDPDTNEMYCKICGERTKLNMPIPCKTLCKKIDAFVSLHEECNYKGMDL